MEYKDRDYYIEVAQEILRLALEKTPVKSGILADSYYIEIYGDKPNEIKIVNDCDYAIYVHEMIDNLHKNGGQAKFLEDAGFEVESVFNVKTYMKLSKEKIELYIDKPVGYPVNGEAGVEDNVDVNDNGASIENDDETPIEYDKGVEPNMNRRDKLKIIGVPLEFDFDTHRISNNNLLNKIGVYIVKTLGNKKTKVNRWEGVE